MAKTRKSGYERQKQRSAETQRQQALAGRDIGPIPLIANVRRRKRCEKSLRLFCETYNPAAFTSPDSGERWPWSDDQLEVISRIEQAVEKELCLAFALPRGSAKTGLCRMAILWATANALVPYAFLISSNEDKAIESLDAIKLWCRTLPAFAEDYPEISIAARALGGIANRASGQLCQGKPTFIRWETTRLVFPMVPRPKNLKWRGKSASSPASGVVIGVSGLTGEGIRGSLFPHPDGRQVRPRLVLLDDPQTDESAGSPTQNATRFRLIRGAVLGMAAPGSRISAVMPCTVIQRGDMADQALDRRKNPSWRGIRRGMLKTMPKHLDAWEKYYEVYRRCLSADVPDMQPANDWYIQHREILDEGAEAAWNSRKGRNEISAIQHAMNLRCELGEEAWQSEYQNAPVDRSASAGNPLKLTTDVVAYKLSRVPNRVVPKECEHLSAYIDVHGRVLYWCVSAWSPTLAGGPIDYGTYPQQHVAYFTQDAAPVPMSAVHPNMVEDAFLLASLEKITAEMLAWNFTREDGRELKIGKILIDVKWGEKNKLLRSWCRRHPQHGRVVHAAQGLGIGPQQVPMDDYRPDGARVGCHWRDGPPKNGDVWVTIDTNWWKSTAAARLALPSGTTGAWHLFGNDPRRHGLFADHCVAEEPVEVAARGRTVTTWVLKPNKPDNHWWDCLVGSAVGGSMLGAVVPGLETRTTRKDPSARPSLSDLAGRR